MLMIRRVTQPSRSCHDGFTSVFRRGDLFDNLNNVHTTYFQDVFVDFDREGLQKYQKKKYKIRSYILLHVLGTLRYTGFLSHSLVSEKV